MNEPLETIMEVREEFTVSLAGDSEPILRTAHFLKPIANSIDGPFSEFFEPKEWPLAFHINGWRIPSKKWVEWVDTLHPKYESLWKKVGIFEAIMSTKCKIVKNQDLVFGVAEKWCSKTNTFLFPWGEATITLEDVMVLGGYPVVGNPVFTPLQNQEMKEIEEKLILARQEPWRTRRGRASTSAWMNIFINSGSEIEHEAFLATWLSMFVFTHNGSINNTVFPLAIHLARGIPIALAPAVLASIYKDLGCLKETLVDFTKNPVVGDKVELEVTLQSPFYLVQIWVWERFKNLQPEPKLINNEDPILARWHKVKALTIDNVRLAFNLAAEDFLWRPYVRYAGKFKVFYAENEIWVPFDTNLDKELSSFVTCLRVSELVGIDSTIKQYLPHRVAMQFNMDQDVPGCVPRFNETKAIAWANYCRPICDRNLYFPPRPFLADVTTGYVRWWKQSVLDHQDPVKNIVRRKRSPRSPNHGTHSSKVNRSGHDADLPPGFPLKLFSTVISGKSCNDVSKKVTSGASIRGLEEDFEDANGSKESRMSGDRVTLFGAQSEGKPYNDGSKTRKDDVDADAPSGFLTKPLNTISSVASIRGLEEDFEDANGSKESTISGDRVTVHGTQGEGYSSAYEINVEELIQRNNKFDAELEQGINELGRVVAELMKARFGHS